ncbi:MAG: DUF4446 family protein [Candidatus Wildermuthbacteria bacterium]|nr:DUF4446 family protein [Candidatus Wildermuthbacteria bacterium]
MLSMFSRNKENAELLPKELEKRVKALEGRAEKLVQDMRVLEDEFKSAVTKIGIVRFNPFREAGGDQSFSVAFLNKEHSGVVVTSHYGKDINRIYAKEVQTGASPYALSEEEKEAIEKAIARAT